MSKGGGSSGGGSATQTSTQKAEPWGPAAPYLRGGLSELGNWYSSPYNRNPYPGSTVVPFSPMSNKAFGMVADRALSGSPVQAAGNRSMLDTISGKYLDPSSNPYLSGTFDLAAGKIRSAMDSAFNSHGSGIVPGTSTLEQGAMGSQLGDFANQLYGGQYANERSNQLNATAMAPQYAAADYNDASQLGKVGSAYEAKAGQNLQDTMDRFNFYNMAPLQRIRDFLSIASPVAGMGGVQSMTSPTNPGSGLTNVLGGLSTGVGLFNQLGTLFGGSGGSTPVPPTGTGHIPSGPI